MNEEEITVIQAGASGYIAGVCRELRIAEIINRFVKWDKKQWKVSPGTRAVALIINILVQRRPLYRVWESFEDLDLPVLFDEPVELDDLNDDGFGRTLDRMYESDACRMILSSASLAAVHKLPLGIRSVHGDTTSISLAGQYNPTESDLLFVEQNPDRQLLNITYGHNKDHRPDLKQFKYGLVVSREGMPLVGNAFDGNVDDKVWNHEILDEISGSFLDPRQIIYIADAALIAPSNLKKMHDDKIRFISRLPGTYGLVDTLKAKAWEHNNWEQIGKISLTEKGAQYQAQSYDETLDGNSYRFVVVHSDALECQKSQSLQRALKRESEAIAKAKVALEKQRFDCEQDAEKALSDFLKQRSKGHYKLQGSILRQETVKRNSGRPKKDEQPNIEVKDHLLLAACLSNSICGRTLPCSRVREQHEQTISYLSTKPVLPNAAIA